MERKRAGILPVAARWRAGLWLLLCLGALPAGCGGAAKPDRPNLLLVVVDTLRQDHLPCYGYETRPTAPELARFAAESVQLTGLTSVSSWTKTSMATLFTGLPPAVHKVASIPDNLHEEATLAETLRKAGYETACIMSNFLISARRRGEVTGYAQGFEFYDDEVTRRGDQHLGSTAQEITTRGLNWLQRRKGEQPWFLMLHYFDPHVSYLDHPEYGFADPKYRGWVKPSLRRDELRVFQAHCSDADRAQLAAYYDGEVRAVDDAFARVWSTLRARPDWDDTLVIFTTDHGEELGERGYIGHTISLHHELVDLPLLVRLPGRARAGTRIEARLPQIDLFATILELCGVAGPPGRGTSFASMLQGEEPVSERPCYSEVDFYPIGVDREEKVTRQRSLIYAGLKLVRDRIENAWYLYDLEHDPRELVNLAEDPAYEERKQELMKQFQSHDWLVVK